MRFLSLMILLGCHPEPPEPQGDGPYVRGRFHDLFGTGIGGVSVCAREVADACVTTDDGGTFLLEGLPEHTDLTVLLDHEGHFPTALPHFSDDTEPPWDKVLLTDGMMGNVADRVDEILDPDLGHFSFMVHQAHFREGKVDQSAGIRFHLEPDPQTTIYYLNSFQLANPDLEETTSSGGGGTLNVPPGRYDVVFEGAGGPCSRIESWDFPPGDRVPIEIMPGRGTYVDVLCPEP